MRVYPAIDLREGQCVRLYQGDYEQQTVYHRDPSTVADTYRQAGAEWVHVVDLDGARGGRFRNLEIIAQIASCGLSVQAGGGIRDREGLEALLGAGVQRAVIGSLAVKDPDRVGRWLSEYGAERICLALDVRQDEAGEYRLATSGWTEASSLGLEAGLKLYAGTRLRHVLCTDVSRDGTLQGPSVHLYRELTRQHPDLAIQASGGVRDRTSIEALRHTGVDGVIVGRAIYEGRLDLEEAIACSRVA